MLLIAFFQSKFIKPSLVHNLDSWSQQTTTDWQSFDSDSLADLQRKAWSLKVKSQKSVSSLLFLAMVMVQKDKWHAVHCQNEKTKRAKS